MTTNGWVQIAFFSICFLLVAKPLGLYLVRVFDGSLRWLRPVENLLYRISGVNPQEDQHWTRYAAGMLLFSAASMLFTYVALRIQHLLPLNPQSFAAVPDRQAFETAASFTTNTNWQSYSGESTMSYLSQMMQLAFHNFISAAVGIALAVALVRGIARRGSEARGLRPRASAHRRSGAERAPLSPRAPHGGEIKWILASAKIRRCSASRRRTSSPRNVR